MKKRFRKHKLQKNDRARDAPQEQVRIFSLDGHFTLTGKKPVKNLLKDKKIILADLEQIHPSCLHEFVS